MFSVRSFCRLVVIGLLITVWPGAGCSTPALRDRPTNSTAATAANDSASRVNVKDGQTLRPIASPDKPATRPADAAVPTVIEHATRAENPSAAYRWLDFALTVMAR